MGFSRFVRSLAGRPVVERVRRDVGVVDRTTRTFLVRCGARPMRVHIEDDTDAARLAATQTSGLCGLARVNGRFVTLHDLGQQEQSPV